MTAEELKAVEVDIPPPVQAPPTAGHMQRIQAPPLPRQYPAGAQLGAWNHMEAHLGAFNIQWGMPMGQLPLIPPPRAPIPVPVARPRRVAAKRR